MESKIHLNVGFLIWQQFFITLPWVWVMLRDLETFCLKLFCLLISHIAAWLWFHGVRNSLMSTVTTEEATFANVVEGGQRFHWKAAHTACTHISLARRRSVMSSLPTERLCRYSQSNSDLLPYPLLLTGDPLITLSPEEMARPHTATAWPSKLRIYCCIFFSPSRFLDIKSSVQSNHTVDIYSLRDWLIAVHLPQYTWKPCTDSWRYPFSGVGVNIFFGYSPCPQSLCSVFWEVVACPIILLHLLWRHFNKD